MALVAFLIRPAALDLRPRAIHVTVIFPMVGMERWVKVAVIVEPRTSFVALDSKKKLLCETYKVVMFSIAFDIFWLFLALTVIPLLKFLMFGFLLGEGVSPKSKSSSFSSNSSSSLLLLKHSSSI